jgi:hypothetical protein
VVVDGDYGARKTVLIDDDVIHLPGNGKGDLTHPTDELFPGNGSIIDSR